MPTLLDIIQQIRNAQAFDVRALEVRVAEEIASRTGAARGNIPGRSSIFVRPISLEPFAIAFNLDTVIDWIVRRIQATGTRIFNLSLGQHDHRLVLIAQWQRNTQISVAA